MVTKAEKVRRAIRKGDWTVSTTAVAPGHVMCGVVILPKSYAYDFMLYCHRNPKPGSLVEVTDAGDPVPRLTTPGADLRTDIGRYQVFRDGRLVDEVRDLNDVWRDDLVAFLIGSSVTFDPMLNRAGAKVAKFWVLNTAIPTVESGPFSGPMVVSMRWFRPEQAIAATQITSRYPLAHGAPVHMGSPAAIGADLRNPVHGNAIEDGIPAGVMPVFWGCNMTLQHAALRAKPELMITHAPGHSFITDLTIDRFTLT